MTVPIIITTDAPRLERTFARLAGQLPFATSLAINNTAKDLQKSQTDHILRVFTIRRQPFARRAIKIRPFSSKRNLEAVVRVEPPGGAARADIFAKFETRTIKTPRAGPFLAVPIQARRGKTGVVGRANRPRALLNKRNVFAVFRRRGRLPPGIYQRLRSGLRMLYIFKRQVPIDDRLDFVENARKVIPDRFPKNFRTAFDRALRTAR